jgi:hypothetical protein
MRPTDQQSAQAKVEARYRVLLTLWSAFVMTVGVYALIAYLAAPQGADAGGDDNNLLFWILAALGVSTVAISFALKRQFLAQAADKQRPELVQTGLVIALVLCETAAIFGLLSYFITRERYSYFLFIIAALGMLLHRPRREHLHAASFKAGGFTST